MRDPNNISGTTGRHEALPAESTSRRAAVKENTGRSSVREYTGKHQLDPRSGTARTAAVREGTGRSTAVRERTGKAAAVREQTGKSATVRENTTGTRSPAPPAAPEKKGINKRTVYMLIAVFSAVLVLAVAVLIRSISDGREYTKYYQQAIDAYDCGDYNTALSHLRKAYSKDRSDECVVFMADCYDALKNYGKALELLTELDSRSSAVTTRIDQLVAKQGQYQNVEKVSVAGREYPADTDGIVLDNLRLGNGLFDQLTDLYALTNISAAGNGITDISRISTLGGLTTLNLSDNAVSELYPLAGLTALRTLYLDDNPIVDFTPLYSLVNLTTLSIKGVDIAETQLAELSAALPNCAIHSETAHRSASDITLGGISFKSDVSEVDLNSLGLRDVAALSGCRSLSRIDLHGNSVSDLSPLMDIPGLMWLDISDNVVSELCPIMGLNSIATLKASGNYINNTAAFSMLTGLFYLDLDDNPIRDFSGLAGLRSLETLSLKNTGLTDDALPYLYGLNSLRSLDIQDNPGLTGDAVEQLKQRLPNCTVDHSQLDYYVRFGSVRFLTDAESVDISGLGIEDISELYRFGKLKNLYMANNAISNIYTLRLLPGLRYVDMSGNRIEEIGYVSGLSELEYLDLSYNNVSSVEVLKGLTSLRSLKLVGNPLTEEQLWELSDALPNCDIQY